MVLVLVDSIEAVAIGPAFPRFCVVLLGASSPIVIILSPSSFIGLETVSISHLLMLTTH